MRNTYKLLSDTHYITELLNSVCSPCSEEKPFVPINPEWVDEIESLKVLPEKLEAEALKKSLDEKYPTAVPSKPSRLRGRLEPPFPAISLILSSYPLNGHGRA